MQRLNLITNSFSIPFIRANQKKPKQFEIFNTKSKTIVLTDGRRGDSTIIETMDNVSTVKVSTDGFYEVMQRPNEDSNALPVMRLPIAHTNMFIVS